MQRMFGVLLVCSLILVSTAPADEGVQEIIAKAIKAAVRIPQSPVAESWKDKGSFYGLGRKWSTRRNGGSRRRTNIIGQSRSS